MQDSAVIFDVDGPLLELTPQEEDRFFAPLKARYGLSDLSRDWDSYRIRNDIEIYREILERHVRPDDMDSELNMLVQDYIDLLETGYASQDLDVVSIPGARVLLERLASIPSITLGIATANLRAAARVRLIQAGMWDYVRQHPGAADSGGAKKDILANVLANLNIPQSRIIFLGDNLNDLEAGVSNGVHFIGFHTDEARRERLTDAGAQIVSGDHETTWTIINELLDAG